MSTAVPAPPAGRISDAEALALLEGGDLLGAGARADAVRRRLHPGDEVTFIVDRNINYTDYCLSGCRFCAFYKKPGSGEGYLLAEADIHRKIEETLELGGTAIMMQGGLHPDLDICWFEQVFSGIKARYPIHIHSLSPPEIVHIAKQSGLSVEETLTRLHAAGLDSLPGGGAEVLVDRVRTAISPHKIPTDTWLDVMRVAHGLGMKTTATMMFGSLDTPAERIEHLRRLRDVQDETGGFTAFIPWTFQAGNTDLQAGHVPATGVDYLHDALRLAHLPRQLPQRPGLLGHPRIAHGAGLAGLRRQRHGLDDDRGERGRRRRSAKSVRRRRDGARSSAPPAAYPCSATRCTARCGATRSGRSWRFRARLNPA